MARMRQSGSVLATPAEGLSEAGVETRPARSIPSKA